MPRPEKILVAQRSRALNLRRLMKKILIRTLKALVATYVVLCIILFMFQEKLIFLPKELDKNFKFAFDQKFEERNIKTKDGKVLNGVLFTSDSSKGLIFYLH